MYTYVCRVPTIAEYLYMITTLRYNNEKAKQILNIQIDKYEIVFGRY